MKFGFSLPLVKQLLDRVAGVACLGNDQRELAGVRNGRGFHLTDRMLRRRNQNQFVAMNEHHSQPGSVHGKRDHPEIYRIIDDRFENAWRNRSV